MPTILEQLNQELEGIGRRAQAVFGEARTQLEMLRTTSERNRVAQDLGLLIHRRERGGAVEPAELEALLRRLDELEGRVAELQGQLPAAPGGKAGPPAPTPAPDPAAGPGPV